MAGVEHYENFPVASILLPRRLRPAVRAVYHFARTADDFADEGQISSQERLAGLNGLEEELNHIEATGQARDAAFAPLAQTIEKYKLPLTPFRQLLSAFRQDVTKTRYATYEELLDYCRRSADPVGRIILLLLNITSAKQQLRSDAICTALQLINHWQDVAVDWKKGRMYLPQEDLHRFGVSEEQIAQGRCNVAWSQLMAYQLARSRALMGKGRPLAYDIRGRMGWELRATVAGGLSIAGKIEAVHYDVFQRRPTLHRKDSFALLWAVLKNPASNYVSP